jgi:hypothetical protein
MKAMSQTEILRRQVTRTIEHGTALIADLKTLARGFDALVPELADATQRERWEEMARLVGVDAAIPDDVAALIEALADVLAGLTSADAGRGWVEHQRARLAAGEEATAA